jgi:hypothetical protein
MFPALTCPTTKAHRDDLYRDARRRHRTRFAYATNSGMLDGPR